jgi:2-phospho-L-lactate guanylyltransferase
MESVYAVIVARAGNGAKTRLAGALSASDRTQLSAAMLRDVLVVCATSPDLHGVIVVADAPAAAHIGAAQLVADPGLGMNAAVQAGIDAACRAGARTAIVLPGDVPLISHADFRALLAAAGSATRVVVLGASRDGAGTNALLLRPPHAIEPSFGEPSLERHASMARAAECQTVVLRDLGLALDVDTPEDVVALRAEPTLPSDTAEVLAAFAQH